MRDVGRVTLKKKVSCPGGVVYVVESSPPKESVAMVPEILSFSGIGW